LIGDLERAPKACWIVPEKVRAFFERLEVVLGVATDGMACFREQFSPANT